MDDIDRTRLPVHIAIVMDGNGRWARQRGLPRTEGHRRGTDSVDDIVKACRELGVGYLTLYAFSLQNWKREPEEVSALMGLLYDYLERERETIMKNSIRLRSIGEVERLPAPVLERLRKLEEESSGSAGMTLTLALSYGGREEIVRAVKRIVSRAGGGGPKGQGFPAEQVDEEMISKNLFTAGMPDPDLVIRTSGEIRVSNFLLWQISYAELFFTAKLWPDYRRADLYEAIVEYQKRSRRFGMSDEQIGGRSGNV